MTEILRLEWLTGGDIFIARQRAREVASAVGFDRQDQVRVATALSEVARELFGTEPSTATFRLLDSPPRLVVEIDAPTAPGGGAEIKQSPARRLLDSLEVDLRGARVQVTLQKALPRGQRAVALVPERVREALHTAAVPLSPMDELRVQNADLIDTLDELRRQQQELAQLNSELEATNQGVMAMYTQLSAELDETNRGVVALYAELDDKSHQLAEASEAKTRFLRNVSHELRAPVNSILGLAQLLTDSQLTPEQRREVDYVASSGRSLLELVNELLDLARAESDRLDVVRTQVPLAGLLGDLRGTLRPVAAARGVELVISEPEVESIATDADLLTRVLRNLLTNALAFTETGAVRVSATRRDSGQHVEIAVTDTGIGIAPENVERVFEEFFQVPGPLQTNRAGTGLGLPYARRVTQALGGTLTVTSTPGEGSTFTVVLPVESPDGRDHAVPELRIGHVLVVDDDPAFRHIIRGMLQGVAQRVSEAGDGAEALASIATLAPDLVLLDLRMPGVSGAEVLTTLRSSPDPVLRALPTILLTSVDIDAAVRRAAEPAAALLSKADLDRANLTRLIATVLAPQETV